jgi:hypothetical protein
VDSKFSIILRSKAVLYIDAICAYIKFPNLRKHLSPIVRAKKADFF